MAIFHQHKCIFIHSPRTGGTTIHNALGGGPKDHFPWNKFKFDPKYNYNEFWDSYLKFATVRNPFDWLVSLYNHPSGGPSYRSQCGCPKSKDPVNIAPSEPLGKRSFEDYARCPTLFHNESPYINQSRTIGPDIDLIIKFENLQEGFDELCERIGRPKSTLNVVGPTANRDKDYKKHYDDKLVQDVSRIFREDLNRFKYSFSNESLWYKLAAKYNYYDE